MSFLVELCLAEVERLGSRIEQAKDCDVHIISEDFVQDVKEGEAALSAIKKKCISSWGGDVSWLHLYNDTSN